VRAAADRRVEAPVRSAALGRGGWPWRGPVRCTRRGGRERGVVRHKCVGLDACVQSSSHDGRECGVVRHNTTRRPGGRFAPQVARLLSRMLDLRPSCPPGGLSWNTRSGGGIRAVTRN
jgi:hypothetical protein